jgi:hypothetical protein
VIFFINYSCWNTEKASVLFFFANNKNRDFIPLYKILICEIKIRNFIGLWDIPPSDFEAAARLQNHLPPDGKLPLRLFSCLYLGLGEGTYYVRLKKYQINL